MSSQESTQSNVTAITFDAVLTSPSRDLTFPNLILNYAVILAIIISECSSSDPRTVTKESSTMVTDNMYITPENSASGQFLRRGMSSHIKVYTVDSRYLDFGYLE